MAERRWGAIASGATFESLATTLVFFEDPKASLFGRRGKDGGQDARSGDGTRVFQAKHHESGSAATATTDAKKEAAKIEKYRQPGHARHNQWNGVTHWRLVTNAVFNPTDKRTWDTDVVPLFAEQGLTADYWERENLNALLDRHPEIHRSFFENETRVFLSLPEVRERLPIKEPFLRRDELGPFCGRQEEKAKLREFLASDRFFLVAHGAGGTGKTRLLVEAGDEIASEGAWQVLWANVESMAATGSWFEAVVPERATLLLVDEPSDDALLQQLAEQLGGRVGRTAHWKVVVAVRSPKDPVLRFLRGARMKSRMEELSISPLPSADAEDMAFELLRTGKRADWSEESRRDAARQLSQSFSRYPVWLTLAIQHLEDHGDLKQIPADAESLADEYLLEIERNQSDATPAEVRTMLRWVALLGTVNRQDDTAVRLIGEPCGISSLVDVRERLASLVRRRALAERGARNRFVELKPDVLRDHVLLRWLAKDVGGEHPEVSDDGNQLLATVLDATSKGGLSALGRAILKSLARTEFILRLSGHEVGLLETFFGSLEMSIQTMTASQRLTLPGVVEAIAYFHPRVATSVARTLRMNVATDETIDGIFGPKVIRQTDVVLALAWPLFGAAMGAQSAEEKEAVLRELCALAEAEAELASGLPGGLPNDGKRAAALVARVLEGGPQFWSEYDDTAAKLGTELIDTLTRQAPSTGQLALLKGLIQPLLATQRHQTWAEDMSFRVRMFTIAPGGTAWQAREAVLAQLREALKNGAIPSESLVQLWHVFAEARDGEALETLEWTHRVLTSRSPSLDELTAAREVWDWHRRYQKRPEVKAAAEKLEAVYASNDLAREFQPLVPSIEDWKEMDGRAAAKAAELSAASDSQALETFLDRATAFGGEDLLVRLGSIAWSLGALADSHDTVREFVEASFPRPSVTPREEFIVATAVSWVAAVRKREPAQADVLVQSLLSKCANDERRAHLLERIYGRLPKLSVVGDFTPEEHVLLRSSCGLFTSTGRDVQLVAALASTVGHEWSSLRPRLESVLRDVPPGRRHRAAYTLVDAIYWAVREDAPTSPPAGLAEWLMTQLLALPDFDDLGGNGEWHLAEIVKRLGPVDLQWLPGALAQRQQREASARDPRHVRGVSHNARISKYVRKIDSDTADSQSVTDAVGKVLDLIEDNGSVGYYLPEVLRDIDPEGFVVPAKVAARAATASDAEGVRRLARIGDAYAVNSSSWRTIALAAVRAASLLGSDALRAVYGSLGERGIRSWSGAVGEVPPIFIAAVTEARANLDAEVEEDLRPYWRQRLEVAEADLREQEERAKEDRGE
jgi:hypothetical protein